MTQELLALDLFWAFRTVPAKVDSITIMTNKRNTLDLCWERLETNCHPLDPLGYLFPDERRNPIPNAYTLFDTVNAVVIRTKAAHSTAMFHTSYELLPSATCRE
jgi:hypothetical protein